MTDTCFAGFLAGNAGFRAGAFAFALEEAALFGAEGLRAGAALAVLPLTTALLLLAAVLEPDFVFDFAALRAGAFSEDERLTIGLGRAVLAPNLRFFAEDAGVF